MTNNIPKTCGDCEYHRIFTPEGFAFRNCQLKRDLGYKNCHICDSATRNSGNYYTRTYNIRDKECPLTTELREEERRAADMSKFRTASAMMQEWEESSKRMQTEAEIRADERKKVLEELSKHVEVTRAVPCETMVSTTWVEKAIREWLDVFIAEQKGEQT